MTIENPATIQATLDKLAICEIANPEEGAATEETEKTDTYFQCFLQLGQNTLQYCKENPKKVIGGTMLVGGGLATVLGPILTTLMITKAATTAGGALTAGGGSTLLFYDKYIAPKEKAI